MGARRESFNTSVGREGDSASARLARNLRRRRIECALSQEALAAQVGLSQTYLSQVECGSRNVSLDKIERLAEALQIDVVDLLGL
ncbi:MAG TPA: helix-turn-helix transcriptional regulator [Paucimonas sp.]|nr:helix-turn-helix transcriptional regulator [Paucimonas sp.]